MYALEMVGITKEFPGTRALDRVSFSVEQGTIHAVIGENGAGKSTLMKILSGVYPAETYEGTIRIGGKEVRFRTPRDAEAAGIAVIHQELSLVRERLLAPVNRLVADCGMSGWRLGSVVVAVARERRALSCQDGRNVSSSLPR